jgi:hypothetical protein
VQEVLKSELWAAYLPSLNGEGKAA